MNEASHLEGGAHTYPATDMRGDIRTAKHHLVYLGLGSNITPDQNLLRGVAYLRQYVIVMRFSYVWETEPIPPVGPHYLNAAALVQTQLTAGLLKSIILRRIEVQLGRIRTSNKNAPRTIDLDILVYDGQLMDAKIWTYAFVAVPLADLLPGFVNPMTGETLRQAADRLSKETIVKKRPEIVLEA